MKHPLLVLLSGYIVFISIFIGLVTIDPPGSVSGKVINEIMQDQIEMLFGINNLLDSALREPLKYILHDKNDLAVYTGKRPSSYVVSVNDFSINQRQNEAFTLGNPGRGFFLEGRVPGVSDSRQGSGNYFTWNSQLNGHVILDFDRSFFHPSIVLRITGPVILLFICFLFTLNSLFPEKPFENWKSTLNIFNLSCCFPLYFVAFISWLIFFLIYFPCPRNYENSYHSTFTQLKSHQNSLKFLLDSTPETSLAKLDCLQDMSFNTPTSELVDTYLFPLGRQEKNIHNGSVFVSKKPFFPYNYIRINVDLFNYLFYAPGLTLDDLNELNDQMEYRYLGNDIWLGQYRKYIDAVTELHRAYVISILLWSIMILISIYKYRKILKRSDMP